MLLPQKYTSAMLEHRAPSMLRQRHSVLLCPGYPTSTGSRGLHPANPSRRTQPWGCPAAAPAPGPNDPPSGSPSSSMNEQLRPIMFRFTDNGPASGSQSSSGSMQTPAGGSGRPGASAGVVPPPYPSTSTGTNGSSNGSRSTNGASSSVSYNPAADSSPSTSQPLQQQDGSDASQGTSNGSYSDYYRSLNTPYQSSQPQPFAATRSIATQTGGPGADDAAVAASPTASSSQQAASSRGSSSSSAQPDNGSGSKAGTAPSSASSSAPDTNVNEALARAQAALAKAESSLDDITKSSRDDASPADNRWTRLLRIGRAMAAVSVLTFGMLASHASGLALQWTGATLGAIAMATYGYKKKSLAMSGAIAAFMVGCGTLGSSLRFGATLIAFFLSSSWLTQYKEEMKEGLEDGAKKGGQRTWLQVACNGGLPVAIAVAYGILAGCVDLPLGPLTGPVEPWRAQLLTASMGGYLGYLACCCGDTWASELGPLSSDSPRLITTMRPVRRGTNGGVTLLGLSASILGGMFIGLVFYLAGIVSPTLWIFEQQRAAAIAQWKLIPLGLMAGLFGSVLDSLLGATVQYTGYNRVTGRIVSKPGPEVTHIAGMSFLDNNAVNFVSASITAALTALAALRIFGC